MNNLNQKEIKDLEVEVQSLKEKLNDLNIATRYNSIAIIIIAISLIIGTLVLNS